MFKRLGCAGLIALMAGCTGTDAAACTFSFSEQPECRGGGYTVRIQSRRVVDDERLLQSVRIEHAGGRQTLEISPDTTMIEGDRGRVIFDDINFDGTADLAVTTSFGVANRYFDYWVYDGRESRFRYAGNYAELTPDPAEQVLRSRIKINAARYENRVYVWDGHKLVQPTGR